MRPPTVMAMMFAAMVLLLSASTANSSGPWPLSVVPREGDDRLEDGLRITTGEDGICDTEVHPDSDDVQVIPLGQGAPDEHCIEAGPSGILHSTPAGDDQVSACGLYITTGADGIRQTELAGDDVELIGLGNGLENAVCIEPGADGILGYHPAPQGMTNTLGAKALLIGLHDALDVYGPVGTACIASQSGSLWYDSRPDDPEHSSIRVAHVDHPPISSILYCHADWDAADGPMPHGGYAAKGAVIGRVNPHPAYPHVHLEFLASEGGSLNPLAYLSPGPSYEDGYPEIVTERFLTGAREEMPRVMLVRDKGAPRLEDSHFQIKADEGGVPFYWVDDDADIIASVRSVSAGTFLGEPASVHSLLPYQASFVVYDQRDYALYSFGGTVFRMDRIPECWDVLNEVSSLLFAEGSVAYERFFVVFTNCDRTDNLDYLANVEENCWPVGQRDEQGQPLVPNGIYQVMVVVADYKGVAAYESITAKVDHAAESPPGRAGDGGAG